jgi:hypothetical protein
VKARFDRIFLNRKVELDYGKFAILDAEELAEGRIVETYAELLPQLRQYVEHPAEVTEHLDSILPQYSVQCFGKEFLIYAPETSAVDAWGKATYVFFNIVNTQLGNSGIRFYAFYGGNDLHGAFLSERDAIASRACLPRKRDWPYIPNLEPPWYGEPH